MDYINPNSVSFSAEDSEGSLKCVSLSLRDDTTIEANETLQLSILNDTSVVTFGGLAEVIIIDNESK